MRERHNIIGSEVGRPRPPFYMRPGLRLHRPRSAARWLWTLAPASLVALGIVLAMVWGTNAS